jgi:hypothetical protein
MPDIKVIFGCAAPWSVLSTDKAAEFLPVLEKHGVRDLDTAHIYVSDMPPAHSVVPLQVRRH